MFTDLENLIVESHTLVLSHCQAITQLILMPFKRPDFLPVASNVGCW